jgi:hypothetical protein
MRHIANLWSLWNYPTTQKPWALERQIVDIKEAGFDGFTTLATPKHGKLAEKYGLVIVGCFATAKSSEFRKLSQQNVDAGAVHINVQLPNSWEDAKILRPLISKAWREALAIEINT